jgi:hypothetical protein
MNGEVLNSWKEIAAYLGRGVRTVQRWERELGLPVRRPRGKDRSAVVALKPDLDRWLYHMPQATAKEQPKSNIGHLELRRNTQLLKLRAAEVVALSQKLHARMAESVALASALNLKQPARGGRTKQIYRFYWDGCGFIRAPGSVERKSRFTIAAGAITCWSFSSGRSSSSRNDFLLNCCFL